MGRIYAAHICTFRRQLVLRDIGDTLDQVHVVGFTRKRTGRQWRHAVEKQIIALKAPHLYPTHDQDLAHAFDEVMGQVASYQSESPRRRVIRLALSCPSAQGTTITRERPVVLAWGC